MDFTCFPTLLREDIFVVGEDMLLWQLQCVGCTFTSQAREEETREMLFLKHLPDCQEFQRRCALGEEHFRGRKTG